MTWYDMMGFLKFCFQTRAWSDMCIAQLFKLKCKNRMQLNTMTCVRASRTFCQRMSTVTGAIFPELCRATRLCGQSMEEIPPSPSCCYKNLSPSALSFLLLQALLEHAEGQKSLTARSQAVERTDKLPECVLSRRSKHAKRYSCRVPLSGLDMSWNWSHAPDVLASIALAVTPRSCQW